MSGARRRRSRVGGFWRDLDPGQRRLLLWTAGAAVAAGVLAGALVVAASRESRPRRHYQPFRVGEGPALARAVRTQRPLFFADPLNGTRGFVLTLDGGDFVALHVVPPGGSARCPVGWDDARRVLADCRGRVYEPSQLARFPVTVGTPGDRDAVLVDLRRILPAPSPPPSG